MAVNIEHFGKHVFRGAVAAPYLEKQGLPTYVLNDGKWTTDGNVDKVSNLKCPRVCRLMMGVSVRLQLLSWTGPEIMELLSIAIGSNLWGLLTYVTVKQLRFKSK
jgi:hypothetical protein